jgi:uncharacterized protein
LLPPDENPSEISRSESGPSGALPPAGGKEAVPEAIPPEELRTIAREIDASFPVSQPGTEIVLLDVDPHRAHAYWNIDLQTFEEGRKEAGPDAPLVIRVHDVTGVDFDGENALETFDVQVQGLQGHWSIDLWKDGRDFVAEIGLLRPDGHVQLFARSNPVTTPLGSPSSIYDTSAVHTAPEVPEELRAADLVAPAAAAPAAGLPSTETGGPEVSASPAERESGSPPVPGEAAAAWPTAEQAAAGMPEPDASVEAYCERHIGPASAISDAQAESEAGVRRAEEKDRGAEPPERRESGTAPLPLESYVNLSSFDLVRKDVLIEVNTELHIYGRVRPGTELSLYGQQVPLRPDGTFSIRQPLPRGAIVLPLLASDSGQPPSGG